MMTTTVIALQSDFWNTIGRGVGAMWLYAAVGLVLMVIAFYAIDLTTPGPLRQMVKPAAEMTTACDLPCPGAGSPRG